MKVLVCGDRSWVDPKPIEEELRKLPPGTIVVQGRCWGVDNIAADIAASLGFEVRSYPVTKIEWKRFGRGAGNIRNAKMLEKEHPDPDGVYIDLVLAWHKDPNLGKGTKHMIGLVRKANPKIEDKVFTP